MNSKLPYIALLSLSYLACSACTLEPSSAAKDVTEQKPGTIRDTVDSLRLIKINIDGAENDIPPAVKPLLTTLKHQIRDVIQTRINSSFIRTNPDELRGSVLADLKDLGVTVEDPEPSIVDDSYSDTSYTYGDIWGISLENPASREDLLVATTTLGVCCGRDTSLYFFQNDGARWDLAMAVEANDYNDVSGAQGRFQYRISSPDRLSNFFVVAANVNPWCTSNWQSLRFKVFRPGQTAYEPRVLLSEERTIWLGGGFEDERAYRLRLRGNRFSLEFYGEKFLKSMADGDDTDDSEPLDVASYKVIQDQVIILHKAVTDIPNVQETAR